MMADTQAQALLEAIAQISRSAIKEELAQVRSQLQDICLHAVEAALDHHLHSDKFRGILKEEIAKTGSGGAVNAEAMQGQLNDLVLSKAKELLRQSVSGGSLDLRKIVTRVVENTLESRRGAAPAGASQAPAELSQTVRAHVKEYLASDEMKELLDSKFRAIDLYLKTDLIPKVVKREIDKSSQSA